MRNRMKSMGSPVFLVLPAGLLLLALVAGVGAQETIGTGAASVPPTEPGTGYVYVTEGRSDPFKPFISPKATTPASRDPNEIVEEGKELTGMQLFEPGQLSLVGIMMTEAGGVALVEDQTRKGYMLKLGLPVGKRGVVTQIDKQRVVITETARTRAGKEITSTVIMRLNKEGDK